MIVPSYFRILLSSFQKWEVSFYIFSRNRWAWIKMPQTELGSQKVWTNIVGFALFVGFSAQQQKSFLNICNSVALTNIYFMPLLFSFLFYYFLTVTLPNNLNPLFIIKLLNYMFALHSAQWSLSTADKIEMMLQWDQNCQSILAG